MANIYKGSFVNTQVDYTDNSPNEQTFFVTITDISATGQNLPYNFSFYTDPSVGDNQLLLNVSWDGLPTGTTEIIIGYRLVGDSIYTNYSILNPDDPGFYGWLVPFGVYELQIQVLTPSGTEYLYVEEPQEYQLEMADAPIVLQTVDNSEDKFTTIKSKSCTIRVFTDDIVNAMTFAGGGDTQYKVQIAVNDIADVIYTGWLSLSDLGQTFQPDPNVLQLTATDGIAFLKSVPLSDDDGRFLQGQHPLIKYIAWCLQKTGLELEIWVQMNLLEVSAIYDYPEYHFYNTVFLDAQTFEANIGELEDCYTVLDKILGEFCELSQQKNKWFIKSIDEANYAQFRICKFNYNGEPDEYITELYTKDIGADSDLYTMAFMNDDARLSLQRPYKSVIHNYDYEYPQEIVQNGEFERGNFMMDLPNETIDSITYTVKAYNIDSWVAYGNNPISPTYPAYIPYIKRLFNDLDYEKERFVVIPYYNTVNIDDSVQSYPIYVEKDDRIEFTIDWRTVVNLPSAPAFPTRIAVLTLKGDDGNWYQLGGDLIGGAVIYNDYQNYQWLNTTNFTTSTSAGIVRIDTDSIEEMEWQTQDWGSLPVPVSGKLYVRLFPISYTSQTHFANLRLTVNSLINGSYQRYTGQKHTSEQDIDTLAIRENQVYMSDAPRIEMKGSMLKRSLGSTIYTGNAAFETGNGVTLDGYLTPIFSVDDYIRITNTTNNNGTFRIVAINYSLITNKTVLEFDEPTVAEIDASTTIESYIYTLTENFYDSIDWPGGGAPQEDQIPYGQHQNQAVWNQFNRVFSAFEASVDGLDTDKTDNLGLPDLPDLMHMYRQQDTHPATYNKQFKCLHYEQDTDNCEWSIYMIEVGDGSIPKSYDGHSFKYIQR